MAVVEIPLGTFGLESTAEAAARRGWAPKSVQNWINAGLLPALVVGSGRSARFLVRTRDVDRFTPPGRGRPKGSADRKPRAKRGPEENSQIPG